MSELDSAAAATLLGEADACHDDEPARARALLARIDLAALPPADHIRAAFLLNHVLGEKFDQWDQALAGQRVLAERAGNDAPLTLRRHLATAAWQAGDTHLAETWTAALAQAAPAPFAAARALVIVAATSFSAPLQDAPSAGRLALRALQPLSALHGLPATALDAQFGAVTSNLASHLLERPLADLQQPDLRTALDLLAGHAQRFWQRAGSWVQHERAHYLRALAANALGEGLAGAGHARAGLALLDVQDVEGREQVDRAFLEQELAQGLRLAAEREADAAEARAQALAAAFADAELTTWFANRAARNAELKAFYRP